MSAAAHIAVDVMACVALGLMMLLPFPVKRGPDGEGLLERFFLWFFRTFGTAARDIRKFRDDVDALYLRRFYLSPRWLARFLERRPWWKGPTKIFLHRIVRSDDDRDPHDHPWAFASLILIGSYRERILKGWIRQCLLTSPHFGPWEPRYHERVTRPGMLLRNKAEHTHRVEIIKPVWSLVFAWPARRVWGFTTQDDTPEKAPLWVPWRKYLGIPEERDRDEDVIVTNGKANGRLTSEQIARGKDAIRRLTERMNFSTPADTGPHDAAYREALKADEETTPLPAWLPLASAVVPAHVPILHEIDARSKTRPWSEIEDRLSPERRARIAERVADASEEVTKVTKRETVESLLARSREHVSTHEASRKALGVGDRIFGTRIAAAVERKGE